jgi:cystathionine gamma-synthase
MAENYKIATLAIHADDHHAQTSDIASPIHLSTTYAYNPDPAQLKSLKQLTEAGEPEDDFVYSRYNQPVVFRIEEVLSKLLDGHAVAYSSGLSAFHAAMIYFNPKNVFVGRAYHGCKQILSILKRNYGVQSHPLESASELIQPGDVIHIESPINPYGTAIDIEKYVKIAHSRGAFVLLDSTFAPPPLQFPFEFGVDMIMHSATKYFGGHSDLLAGVLVSKDPKVAQALHDDRNYIGTITASLESWLMLRSLRTYDLRIRKQVANAVKIVKYLDEHRADFPALKSITHASLQKEEFVKRQLPLNGGPVFSIEVASPEIAKIMASKTKLFHHATSLGGVESLIEWRAMSDTSISDTLLRISVGIEDADDLIEDLCNALKQL